MIGIIANEFNNTLSIGYALDRIGVKWRQVTNLEKGPSIDALIIPGVGHFSALAKSVSDDLRRQIQNFQKPTLGICLGMHLMFEKSEEGQGLGLELIKGGIKKLPIDCSPHMGWNTITIQKNDELLTGLSSDSHFYFTHSYGDLSRGIETMATTICEQLIFNSIVRSKNFYGVQFHPEKSGRNGEILLKNFVSLQ
jgi:glutamine amidotransferase